MYVMKEPVRRLATGMNYLRGNGPGDPREANPALLREEWT